jgi:hypothetical protein
MFARIAMISFSRIVRLLLVDWPWILVTVSFLISSQISVWIPMLIEGLASALD